MDVDADVVEITKSTAITATLECERSLCRSESPGAAMGYPLTTQSVHAAALMALRAGDDLAGAMMGATPDFSRQVREVISEFAPGDRTERRSRASAALIAMMAPRDDETLSRVWPVGASATAPSSATRRFLRELVAAQVDQTRLVEHPSLRGAAVVETFAKLSVTILRAAAEGQRWALRLITRDTTFLSSKYDVGPRIAPALAWVVGAVGAPDLDALRQTWPDDLAQAAGDLLEQSRSRGDAVELRRMLEREVIESG